MGAPRAATAVVGVLAMVALVLATGGPASAQPATQPSSSDGDRVTTGLAVTMAAITPAYLTPGEPVTVRGDITNLDERVWRDLQVYLVMSPSPLTTREQLAAAVASPATAYGGNRVTGEGLFVELGSLPPGESTNYSLEVPFDQLGLLARTSGVYSIGVHVIATDADGVRNSSEATGRARGLIPLMPREVDVPVALSLVWPFQAQVERTAEGTYSNAAELVADVTGGGRLRRLLDLARSTTSVPLTLISDPAVLDALQRIASGSFGPQRADADTDSAPQTAAARAAREFLRDFTALAAAQSLWTQGYGRPDLTSLEQRPVRGVMRSINRATSTTLAQLDLAGRRTYLPTRDVDPDALAGLPSETVALVFGDQVEDWTIEDGPMALLGTDSAPVDVVVADRELTRGGPAPGPTDTALQVRQRVLSETALLWLEAQLNDVSDVGMVFVASPSWNPGGTWPTANFFSGFDAPWLAMTSLDTQVARGPFPSTQRLTTLEPATQSLPRRLLESARLLQRRAAIVGAVTGDGTEDDRAYYDQAVALSVSEYWRTAPATAQALADASLSSLAKQLDGIVVEGPEFVTLSSSSGRFPITVTNTLDQPVTVGVRITADDGSMAFDDIAPVNLRGQESTTFTVQTRAADIGVIGVTASLTTRNGKPFGQRATFSLRTSAVGVVVWIVLGVAAGLIVLAVARQLRRRSRVERGVPTPVTIRTSP